MTVKGREEPAEAGKLKGRRENIIETNEGKRAGDRKESKTQKK
jgi:hypothetical protein